MSEKDKRLLLSCIANGFEFRGDLCKINEKDFLPFGELDKLLTLAQGAFERAGDRLEWFKCMNN